MRYSGARGQDPCTVEERGSERVRWSMRGRGKIGERRGERLGDARILIPAGYARVQRDSEV